MFNMSTGSGRSRGIGRCKPTSVIHRQNTTFHPAKICAVLPRTVWHTSPHIYRDTAGFRQKYLFLPAVWANAASLAAQ